MGSWGRGRGKSNTEKKDAHNSRIIGVHGTRSLTNMKDLITRSWDSGERVFLRKSYPCIMRQNPVGF